MALHTFDNDVEGGAPTGDLLEATDGKLYGVCFGGGMIAPGLGGLAAGSIYRIDKDGTDFEVVKLLLPASGNSSASTTGQRPNSGLMQATDGKLYGVAQQGGTNNVGVIYSVDISGPGAPVQTVIFNFASVSLSSPASVPLEGTDGKLYGITLNGGTFNRGVLYRISKTGSNFEVLHDFTVAEGNGGQPVRLTATRFVGPTATFFGAANTLFTYDETDGYSSTKTFDTGGGTHTVFVTSLGSDGKLYGTEFQADGPSITGSNFVRLNVDGTGLETLFVFSGGSNGKLVVNSFLEIGTGAFAGVTAEGGTGSSGTIFRLNSAGGSTGGGSTAALPSTVKFGKKKVTTAAGKLKITGTCIGGSEFTVEFRVGKKGSFKPAKGSASWSFTAKLAPGKNDIFVQARLADGSVTPAVKATVIRKAK